MTEVIEQKHCDMYFCITIDEWDYVASHKTMLAGGGKRDRFEAYQNEIESLYQEICIK